MNYFAECQCCTPPKRYPGCQDHCEAYKAARKQLDADKQRRKKETIMKNYIKSHSSAVKDNLAKYVKKRGNQVR